MANSKSIGPPSAAAGESAAPAGKSYVLGIGINRYRRLPPLFNAVKDVHEVTRLLTSRYQFDTAPDACTILTDEEATRKRILNELDALTEKLTPQDNLLIYYSGHGTYRENIDEGFWIPVDGDLEDPGSFIPNSTIVKYLKAIKAQHIVVISDACFSGALFTERAVAPEKRQYNVPSRWLLTSGRNEVVSDGRPGQNSPFADSLLLHLRENKEEGLRITQLANIILEDVGSNNAQLPRCEPLRDVGHRGGEFLFWLKGHEIAMPPPRPQPVATTAVPLPQPLPWWKTHARLLGLGGAVVLLTALLLAWPYLFPNKNAGEDQTVALELSQSAFPLGRLDSGAVHDFQVSLRNPATAIAFVDSFSASCPDVTIPNFRPFALAGGGQQAVQARWASRLPGMRQCTLLLYGRNLSRPVQVTATAEITPPPPPAGPAAGPDEPSGTSGKALLVAAETIVPLGPVQTSARESFTVTLHNRSDVPTRGLRVSPDCSYLGGARTLENIPARDHRQYTFTWQAGQSAGDKKCVLAFRGENLTATVRIEVRATVQTAAGPDPGTIVAQPPPPATVQTIDIRTQVPAAVSMYLIVDNSGVRYDALARNNYLYFRVPETLRGQRVTVYFERNGNRDRRTLRLGRDEINLPESL